MGWLNFQDWPETFAETWKSPVVLDPGWRLEVCDNFAGAGAGGWLLARLKTGIQSSSNVTAQIFHKNI